MAQEIIFDFNQPYSGNPVGGGNFPPSVVSINNIPFLMDTSNDQYRRESFEVVKQRNTGDQRDVLLLPVDVWRQQFESWHQGSGQSNTDRNESLPYRFDRSFGIDPFTQFEISLIKETSSLVATVSGYSSVTSFGDYLVLANGADLSWFDKTLGTPTVITLSNNIVDVANDGPVYSALLNNGDVVQVDGPTATPVTLGNYPNANFIAWSKDFLIAGVLNQLFDITAGGAGVLIYTHPVTSFRWDSAAEGDSCIYVSGGANNSYVIHRVGIKQDGTGLDPAIVAATLPDGEKANVISTYLGFVFIGTSEGVRMGATNTDASIVLGAVIPASSPVTCFSSFSRFIWFNEDFIYENDTAFRSGLSRMDLSVLTEPLTPAYATDVFSADQITSSSDRKVVSVCTFDGKRVFVVQGASTGEVFVEGTNKVAEGWLEQGVLSFSLEDLKTGLYVQSKWKPLKGGIDLFLSVDNKAYLPVGSFNNEGSIRSGNAPLNGSQFSRAQPKYVLRREMDDASLGPQMTRWEIRVVPVKGQTTRWTLPIINADETHIDGVVYTRKPLQVLDQLIGLVENSILFNLTESGQSHQVYAKAYTWVPQKLNETGRSWEGLFLLTCEEVQ